MNLMDALFDASFADGLQNILEMRAEMLSGFLSSNALRSEKAASPSGVQGKLLKVNNSRDASGNDSGFA